VEASRVDRQGLVNRERLVIQVAFGLGLTGPPEILIRLIMQRTTTRRITGPATVVVHTTEVLMVGIPVGDITDFMTQVFRRPIKSLQPTRDGRPNWQPGDDFE
jgi:hypothetical protein